jgi:hypothetical protein
MRGKEIPMRGVSAIPLMVAEERGETIDFVFFSVICLLKDFGRFPPEEISASLFY